MCCSLEQVNLTELFASALSDISTSPDIARLGTLTLQILKVGTAVQPHSLSSTHVSLAEPVEHVIVLTLPTMNNL